MMGLMQDTRMVGNTNASWQIHWQQTAELGFSRAQQELAQLARPGSHHYFQAELIRRVCKLRGEGSKPRQCAF